MRTHDSVPYLRVVTYDGMPVHPIPTALEIVTSISKHMDHMSPRPAKRFIVGDNAMSPAEGQKLLTTWLSIRSEAARQAVMDALIAIAEHDS